MEDRVVILNNRISNFPPVSIKVERIFVDPVNGDTMLVLDKDNSQFSSIIISKQVLSHPKPPPSTPPISRGGSPTYSPVSPSY